MKVSRKGFLRLGLAAGAGLFLPFGATGRFENGKEVTGRLLASTVPLPAPFRVPLPVPPVLEPERSDCTTDY
jgi:spore coat protein A, manganese oxidase